MSPIKRKLVLTVLVFSVLLICFEILLTLKRSFNFTSAYTNCLQESSKIKIGECLRKLATVAIKKSTIKDIEETIEPTQGTTNSEWCHEFMHYLGWNKAQKSKTIADAFAGSSFICASGMYHGVVEKYLSNLTNETPLEEKVISVANECEASPETIKNDCYHGLGHAFMFVTDNELLQSTKLCEKLPQSQLQNCFTGVFMEITQPKQATSVHNIYSLDELSPDYPCNELKEESKSDCFVYRGGLNFYLSGQNSNLAFEKCSLMNNYKSECYRGVGYSLLRPNWNTTILAADCDSALGVEKEAFDQCIKGVVPFIMETTQGNPNAANEFCDLLKKENKSCLLEVQNILELKKISQ